ncbi:MAG: hypothetical protein KDH20_15840 [Rhodocyclaceae bacterium]|nr:hypothetical protein [Rhodocyclaceae bacterium]
MHTTEAPAPAQPTTTTDSARSKALAPLRRRLERAELAHLRRVVAEQGTRIESLEAEVRQLTESLDDADRSADLFHQFWLEESEHATKAGIEPARIGITQAGQVVRAETAQ